MNNLELVLNRDNSSFLYNYSKQKVFFVDQNLTNLIKRKGLGDQEVLALLGASVEQERRCLEVSPDGLEKKLFCEITSQCNLSCRHCYGSFGAKGKIKSFFRSFSWGQKEKAMNIREWDRVLSFFRSKDYNVVQFTGGEPVLRKQKLLLLVKKADDYRYKRMELFTNAMLVDESLFGALEEFRDKLKIRISLYSNTPEVHDWITNRKGSFEKTWINLINFKRRSFDVEAVTILMKENIGLLDNIRTAMKKEGIEHSFDFVRPTGRGASLESSKRHYRQFYVPLKSTTDGGVRVTKKEADLSKKFNLCFYKTAAVSPHGDVYPCIFTREIRIGNILKDDLEKIYKDLLDNAEKYNYGSISGCGDCGLRLACHDCRPLVYGMTGDWRAKNPFCPIETGKIKTD